MTLIQSAQELTTTTLATRPPTPAPGAKFSRKRLEKEKTPQGRLFDSFALAAGIGANRLFPFYYKLINKIVIKQIINAFMNHKTMKSAIQSQK